MAIYNGGFTYKDVQVKFWLDPNRHRVIIWGRSSQYPEIFSKKLKRFHGKDRVSLKKRAIEWIDKNLPSSTD
jgi:hypothetical protein